MWLKTVGKIIIEASKIATGFGPVIKTIAPDRAGVITTITDSLNQVADIVVTIEAVGATLQLPGNQKLQAATPLVAQIIMKSDMMIGKKIDDQAKFNLGCQKIADGIVDILNSVKDPS